MLFVLSIHFELWKSPTKATMLLCGGGLLRVMYTLVLYLTSSLGLWSKGPTLVYTDPKRRFSLLTKDMAGPGCAICKTNGITWIGKKKKLQMGVCLVIVPVSNLFLCLILNILTCHYLMIFAWPSVFRLVGLLKPFMDLNLCGVVLFGSREHE